MKLYLIFTLHAVKGCKCFPLNNYLNLSFEFLIILLDMELRVMSYQEILKHTYLSIQQTIDVIYM